MERDHYDQCSFLGPNYLYPNYSEDSGSYCTQYTEYDCHQASTSDHMLGQTDDSPPTTPGSTVCVDSDPEAPKVEAPVPLTQVGGQLS